MKFKNILFIGLIGIVLCTSLCNADQNRFNIVSENKILDFDVTMIEDTQTGSMLYIKTCENSNDFQFQVIKTNSERIDTVSSDYRLVAVDEEYISDFSIIVVQDTKTGDLIYFVAYKDNPESKFQVVQNSKIEMW